MPSLANQDVVVYAHPDGREYLAVDEDGQCWRWPAQHQGWLARQGCPASLVDECEELPPRLGELALRLSGVV